MQHAQQKQQEMINVQEDRMMQMYQEDRKAIEHYRQQGAGNFQMSSKKSLARNFRDYEIYKAVIPQADAYRQYQAAGRGGQKVRRYKLASLTPTQYLKALPQLEDDLATQPMLLKQKLDYYESTYKVLRTRQQAAPRTEK